MDEAKAIELCNRALVDIGAIPISGFDDASDQAKVATQRYESVVESLLSRARWEFATLQQSLSLLSDATPVAEWSYCHQLPTNPKFLRLVRVVAASRAGIIPSPLCWPGGRSGTPYAIRTISYPPDAESPQQRLVLMSNYQDVVVEYVGRVDERQWPPSFDECVVTRMAQAFAESITGNTAMVAIMERRLEGTRGEIGLLGKAIFQDRTNSPSRGLQDDAGFISGR